MNLNTIHINRFGKLSNLEIQLTGGLNVLEGCNESGKTTIAAFIKYIFYGLSGRSDRDGISEKKRYVSGSEIGGYITVTTDDGVPYRIERSSAYSGESCKETVQVCHLQNHVVKSVPCPGEMFFGVPENVFVNTAYVGQLAAVRPDGSSLTGAVENILFSADENVNLKKAADRINQARREIAPKNSGGLLREKTAERDAIALQLEKARESEQSVLESETALDDARRKRIALEEKKEQLDRIHKAAQVVTIKRYMAAAKETAEKCEAYQNALKVLESPPYSTLSEQVDQLKDSLAEENAATYYDKHTQSAEQALEEGEYLESKSRLNLALGISMIIAGITGLLASLVMVYFAFPVQQYMIPVCATVLFVILGIVFYVKQGRYLRELTELLDEWDLETLDDLDDIVATGANGRPDIGGVSEYSDDAVERLNALAKACGIPARTPEETLDALAKKAQKVVADRDMVRGKVENLTGRLSAIDAQLKTMDTQNIEARYKALAETPEGKAAMHLDNEGLKKVLREKEFTESAWKTQYQREMELEKACASVHGETKSPDVLASRLSALDAEIKELQMKADGYAMAYDTLLVAGEEMRSGVIPTVTAKASAFMAAATGGKYPEIAMDPGFGAVFTTDAGTADCALLSRGTADLAYVALRLALTEVLFASAERQVPPMCFDETFAAVDCDRLQSAMQALSKSTVQSLLFTCRGDESSIAEFLNANVIRLD